MSSFDKRGGVFVDLPKRDPAFDGGTVDRVVMIITVHSKKAANWRESFCLKSEWAILFFDIVEKATADT